MQKGLLVLGGGLLALERGKGRLVVGKVAPEMVGLADEARLLIAGLVAGGERRLAGRLVCAVAGRLVG